MRPQRKLHAIYDVLDMSGLKWVIEQSGECGRMRRCHHGGPNIGRSAVDRTPHFSATSFETFRGSIQEMYLSTGKMR